MAKARVRKKKGQGSFSVPGEAFYVLLDREAPPVLILAYLVLAKATDASGKFSRAGLKSVKKRIGIGEKVAARALQNLSELSLVVSPSESNGLHGNLNKLVYSTEEWERKTGEVPPPAAGPYEVHWVLNDFASRENPEERAWFSNTLVTGIGKFTRPLVTLRQLGYWPLRLLMEIHRTQDYDTMTVDAKALRHEYDQIDYQETETAFDVSNFEPSNQFIADEFLERAIPKLFVAMHDIYQGESSGDIEAIEALQKKLFWNSFTQLKNAGFIYEAIFAFDGRCHEDESTIKYTLGVKARIGRPSKSERGLGTETARIAGKLGMFPGDAEGNFDGTYSVIHESTGTDVNVAGLYRLRFRVANGLNKGIGEAWKNLSENDKSYSSLLRHFEENNDLYPR